MLNKQLTTHPYFVTFDYKEKFQNILTQKLQYTMKQFQQIICKHFENLFIPERSTLPNLWILKALILEVYFDPSAYDMISD